MTLVDALNAAAGSASGMTAAHDELGPAIQTAIDVLNGPAVFMAANDPRLRQFSTAPSQAQRPDIRADAFRASPAELAFGILNRLDPRRTVFRATATEMALSWRNLLNGRPIGGI